MEKYVSGNTETSSSRRSELQEIDDSDVRLHVPKLSKKTKLVFLALLGVIQGVILIVSEISDIVGYLNG